MKSLIQDSWNQGTDNCFSPSLYAGLPSQHYLMPVLPWMWSTVFFVSFLTIFHSQIVWLVHVFLIAVIFLTIFMFKRSEKQIGVIATIPALN